MIEHDERDDYDDEPWRGKLAPERVLRWPSSVMWAFGVLQFIFAQTGMIMLITTTVLLEFIDGDQTLAGLWRAVRSDPAFWLVPLLWLLATVWTLLLIRAANDMRRYRRYRSVLAAVIMSMFSVPFFYLAVIQIPIGAWILLVLTRRDVRARFELPAVNGGPTPLKRKAP
ncbi:MAG TPA: hypothetical protein VHR66_27705 [Gemmataceae bacterium]|jgi:hypothetical protein|nr:hypothetical protein [Gemmataceae bacterium]